MTQKASRADELRAAKHPVYSERKLHLGTFSTNLRGGCAISSIDGTLKAEWPSVVELAQLADQMDFEAIVPVGRWRGFGGETDFNGAGFECFTFAAGLSGVNQRSGLFATSHVPTIHPVMAAKQAATIDHMSNGRFALNIVNGWNKPEIEMFGAPLLPHDDRYACAQEWWDIIKLLWTSQDPVTYEGKYYRVEAAVLEPKPLQQPYPVVMNAGGSPTGKRFAAKNVDVLFVSPDPGGRDPDSLAAKVADLKKFARDEFGREVQVWTNAYVVQGDTEADARAYLRYYVEERGDWEAVDNVVNTTIGPGVATMPPEVVHDMKYQFIAGYFGYPIVGSHEQVADSLVALAGTGLDGVLLSWPRYLEDVQRFQKEIYPLLVEAGVR